MPLSCLKNTQINYMQLIHEEMNSLGVINRLGIAKIIPYGNDFLFLDYVSSITNQTIEGYFEVKESDPYVKSHFVHSPIMPGCLIAESFAQAGTILIRYNLGITDPIDIYVGKIETAKYIAAVKPGFTLQHKVTLKNLNQNLGIARLQGETIVNKMVVAEFSIILALSKRTDL